MADDQKRNVKPSTLSGCGAFQTRFAAVSESGLYLPRQMGVRGRQATVIPESGCYKLVMRLYPRSTGGQFALR